MTLSVFFILFRKLQSFASLKKERERRTFLFTILLLPILVQRDTPLKTNMNTILMMVWKGAWSNLRFLSGLYDPKRTTITRNTSCCMLGMIVPIWKWVMISHFNAFPGSSAVTPKIPKWFVPMVFLVSIKSCGRNLPFQKLQARIRKETFFFIKTFQKSNLLYLPEVLTSFLFHVKNVRHTCETCSASLFRIKSEN